MYHFHPFLNQLYHLSVLVLINKYKYCIPFLSHILNPLDNLFLSFSIVSFGSLVTSKFPMSFIIALKIAHADMYWRVLKERARRKS